MTNISTTRKSPGSCPEVIIVGAGLGGLTLGLLLEAAGVPYQILERASCVRPLGSAMSIGASLMPLFIQVGIFDEIVAAGKPMGVIGMHDDRCNILFEGDLEPRRHFGGFDHLIIPRPLMYDIFYNRVPKEKIFHDKRVQTMVDGKRGVRVECSDGSAYHGDILVGADGAYSAVRQGMHKTLKREKKLPAPDCLPLPYSCICLVGQTVPLNPELYPCLKEPKCIFNNMNATDPKKPYCWITFTTKQNTVCWMVLQYLTEMMSKENQDDNARNSEWSPEAAHSMCRNVEDFPILVGEGKQSTLGDLFEKTPKSLISRVVLEEKVFKTWYSGRTVLLGDACHKMSPTGGSGAMCAIQDAVCLANWINVLPSSTVKNIEKIFKEYHTERYPIVMDAYRSSLLFAANGEKNWQGALVRSFFTNIPKWLWLYFLKKMVQSRPLVSFLPPVEDKGTSPPIPQPSYVKTRAILDQWVLNNTIAGRTE
ncbi:hypothetical protein BGZ83_002216 [Gryganskiella cystojenkinii]|nr:hypothetical protein BGZ83_002216 [Gryganskiella cystojenkinii]